MARFQNRALQSMAVTVASGLLCGCMGGPIAGQLASSLAMHSLDKATSDAYEAHLLKDEPPQNAVLKDTEPDEYWASFVTSGFSTIAPVSEPLPDAQSGTPSALPVASQDQPTPQPEANRLVRVELWNLLIGNEKQGILEQARAMGALGIPPASEWPQWQVATGSIPGGEAKPITFLIPPGFGKVRSGDLAVVEMAGAGEINIARYHASR